MAGGFIACLAHDRHAQAPPDDGGDVPERHTLFGDAVVARVRALLEHEPVETRGIAPMHRGPSVHPVPDIGRSAFAVDGRPDLGMVVYNPATPADAEKIKALMAAPHD